MDLRHPDAWNKNRDERFVKRVLLYQEQCLIRSESNPDLTLWVLWAAKETAYKIVSKSHPAVHSGPLKYAVHLIESAPLVSSKADIRSRYLFCSVETPVGPVRVDVMAVPDYVHAFGCQGDQSRGGTLHLKIFGLGQHSCQEQLESLMVRKALFRYLSRFWQIDSGRIGIRREQGVRGLGPPKLYVDGSRIQADISLSHHGRYGAFAVFAAAGNNLFSSSP